MNDANLSGLVDHSSDHFVNDLFRSFLVHVTYHMISVIFSSEKKVFDNEK